MERLALAVTVGSGLLSTLVLATGVAGMLRPIPIALLVAVVAWAVRRDVLGLPESLQDATRRVCVLVTGAGGRVNPGRRPFDSIHVEAERLRGGDLTVTVPYLERELPYFWMAAGRRDSAIARLAAVAEAHMTPAFIWSGKSSRSLSRHHIDAATGTGPMILRRLAAAVRRPPSGLGDPSDRVHPCYRRCSGRTASVGSVHPAHRAPDWVDHARPTSFRANRRC